MRVEREGNTSEAAGKIFEMSVEWSTPEYMVKEKLQREKLRKKAGKETI